MAGKVETHGAGTYKFELPLKLSELIQAYPVAGVGRGALGDASGWLIERNARVLYTENLPTQWWIEWAKAQKYAELET